mmetsp:Transcript_48838/g.114396  ORF Transcript_48838/g.114396 Transcript_48838/m.114396 type:complete len:232 (-) Transcript_48838:376-1071(-)
MFRGVAADAAPAHAVCVQGCTRRRLPPADVQRADHAFDEKGNWEGGRHAARVRGHAGRRGARTAAARREGSGLPDHAQGRLPLGGQDGHGARDRAQRADRRVECAVGHRGAGLLLRAAGGRRAQLRAARAQHGRGARGLLGHRARDRRRRPLHRRGAVGAQRGGRGRRWRRGTCGVLLLLLREGRIRRGRGGRHRGLLPGRPQPALLRAARLGQAAAVRADPAAARGRAPL